MKQVSKDLRERIEATERRYAEARSALESAQEHFNASVSGLLETLNKRVEDVNHVIAEAEELRAQAADEIEEFMGERSEKWQESDAGSMCQEWLSQWQEEFTELELLDQDDVDALQDLPEVLFNDDTYPTERPV